MRSHASAMHATQNDGPCRQVPRLPLATQKCCGVLGDQAGPSAPPDPAQAGVPCMPRKTKADVTKCHTCRAKRRSTSPSATPATQKCRGVPGDQADPSAPPDPCAVPRVPCMPRKAKADVTKCHACHAKCKWTSPSATPATSSSSG